MRTHVSCTASRYSRLPVAAYWRKKSCKACGWGNLGAPPSPPCTQSTCASKASAARRGRVASRAAAAARLHADDALEELLAGSRHVVRALAVRARDRLEDARETREAVAVGRGEVGPAVEGPSLGGEKDGERPAAVPGEELDGLHVHVVDVGALLAVDLHVHEELVHQARDGRVLEALPLHHVTPVAGRVADREEDRLARRARRSERLLPPRVPVDRVVGVLEKVRARLVREPVRHQTMLAPPPAGRNPLTLARQADSCQPCARCSSPSIPPSSTATATATSSPCGSSAVPPACASRALAATRSSSTASPSRAGWRTSNRPCCLG